MPPQRHQLQAYMITVFPFNKVSAVVGDPTSDAWVAIAMSLAFATLLVRDTLNAFTSIGGIQVSEDAMAKTYHLDKVHAIIIHTQHGTREISDAV